MKKFNNDLEDLALKTLIISKNNTFKTAFKATLGFYVGQFVATILGLLVIVFTIYILYKFLK